MGAFVEVKGNSGYVDLIPVAHDLKDSWMQLGISLLQNLIQKRAMLR